MFCWWRPCVRNYRKLRRAALKGAGRLFLLPLLRFLRLVCQRGIPGLCGCLGGGVVPPAPTHTSNGAGANLRIVWRTVAQGVEAGRLMRS